VWGPVSRRANLALAVLIGFCVLFAGHSAHALAKSCDGPPECCPQSLADALPAPVAVKLGVVLVGLYNVNEKQGTWDADFYLNESWPPTPGFTPATEIVNENSHQGEQFDDTELRDGRCFRSRRIHSTVHSSYNLRVFPFDHQRLTLEFSDAEFSQDSARYTEEPSVAALDENARSELSNWKIEGPIEYARRSRVFVEDGAAPRYDYATFSVPVRRHITFHLTRFFLPLFVIVAVALTVFWIDPEDLNSKVSIGVTCLLAAIAFQFAEAGTLPEIAYLTLADRIYAICYAALAIALMFTIHGNALNRKSRRNEAVRLDRIGRVAFPVGLAVAVAAAVVWSTHAT